MSCLMFDDEPVAGLMPSDFKAMKYVDYDVTTAAHSAVQPYTAYNSTTVGLSGYTPIAVMPMGTSGARCLANLSTNDYSTLYVFTYGAQSVKVRVLYMKS